MKTTIKSSPGFLNQIEGSLFTRWFILGSFIAMLAMALLLGFEVFFWGRVYPGVTVAESSLSQKTEFEAETVLTNRVEEITRSSPAIILEYQGNEWPILRAEINFAYLPHVSSRKAIAIGREGPPLVYRLSQQWKALLQGKDLPLDYIYDEELLKTRIATASAAVSVPPIPPAVEVLDRPDATGSWIEIHPGEPGMVVDEDLLLKTLNDSFSFGKPLTVALNVKTIDEMATEEELGQTKRRAETLLGKTLTLSSDDQAWSLTAEELVTFLDFRSGFAQGIITEYVATLAEAIDRPAQDAAFQYVEGIVTQFRPAKDGLTLDREATERLIEEQLDKMLTQEGEQFSLALPVAKAEPNITLAEVNNLGIKELLGRGTSTYRGSIPGRVHNIALSADRVNGILVAPGEVYSFNAHVGEISAATGYQSAYVIRSGATVLDDGGGVCQTSTTVFRAALNAGLPITERRAHSYRVGYYEQNAKAGLDATIYAPTADLKFLNDTTAHILVQMINNPGGNTLTVEIYGTSDGRVAQILNHRVWDVVPPPPPRYQDDPSIPSGQVKQIDYEAAGAKAKFDYVVTRGGETIFSKTFLSNFQPWQAVYLRGV